MVKNKVKKVYKYATGVAIPEGAQYLSTQVEKRIESWQTDDNRRNYIEQNDLVWHYFLVEVEE